jgi:hypothetical protein
VGVGVPLLLILLLLVVVAVVVVLLLWRVDMIKEVELYVGVRVYV